MNTLIGLALGAGGGWISGYLAAWAGKQPPAVRLEVGKGGAVVGLGFGLIGVLLASGPGRKLSES